MPKSYRAKVKWFSLYSRFFILILQFIANYLIPDHDAHVFVSPNDPQLKYNGVDRAIQALLSGFVRWDGQYFWHIIRYGYTYENILAFFPLYPLLVRYVGSLMRIVCLGLNINSVFLLAMVVVNVWVFVKATVTLYDLTERVFNERFAYVSSIFFCVNPASIFFSALYTEGLFSWLSFTSMLVSLSVLDESKRTTNIFDSFRLCLSFSLPCGLSTLTRSNGLVNFGFYIFFWLRRVAKACFSAKNTLTWFLEIFNLLVQLLINAMLSLAPFFLFQVYSYDIFCSNFPTKLPKFIEVYGLSKNFVLPGNHSVFKQRWCENKIPLAYSYVQKRYWNVGFLNYYELNQWPNFLLAFPLYLILFYNFFKYAQALQLKQPYNVLMNTFTASQTPFILHALFLSVFSLFYVHIQVSTRLICAASPVLYWFCADAFSRYFGSVDILDGGVRLLFVHKLPLYLRFIKWYFLGYFVLGTVLFCNFYPWT